MATQASSTTEASTDPAPFNEEEFHSITDAITVAYRRTCRDLFGPLDDNARTRWFSEFRAFKIVLRLSMHSLNDGNMTKVNYCRHSVDSIVNYHEVTTRLCHELEQFYYGVGERLSFEKQTANFLELKETRVQVCIAWKRDVEAGALAGAAGGCGRNVDGA
jgi:hypothetical protein